jgi:hypothetical protein
VSKWKLSQKLWLQLNYRHFDIGKARQFIKKSDKAIYQKKEKLGLLTMERWTDVQVTFLMENGSLATAEKYHKSINSCRVKKSRLCKSMSK